MKRITSEQREAIVRKAIAERDELLATSPSAAGAVQPGVQAVAIDKALEELEYAILARCQGHGSMERIKAAREAVKAASPATAPSVQPVRMLSEDQEVAHLWDTHVGDPSEKYPLDPGDVANFARALQAKFCEVNGVSIGHASTQEGGDRG